MPEEQQCTYGDSHRRFLKTLMISHSMPDTKAVDLYRSCRDSANDVIEGMDKDPKKAIVKFVQQINAKIEPLNLSIKLVICEATNEKCYVLYTVDENDITKAASARQRGKNERALLKTVIKAIIKSPTGKVTIATCARECADLPDKIKRPEVLKLLNKLTLEGWLVEINEQIYIGPRAVVELGKYIKDEFGEAIGICKLCNQVTTRGPECPSNCGVKVHVHCLNAYFKKVKGRKCMGCKEPWPVTEEENSQNANHADELDDSMEVDDD